MIFPIYISSPKGELYGFCPSKATREPYLHRLMRVLMIASETGAMLKQGAQEDQPEWFIELLGWFIPRYDSVKFMSKASSIVGRSAKNDHKALVAKVKSQQTGGGGKRGGHNR